MEIEIIKMLALSISKPCQEKWENMIPGEQGTYCGSCCQNVIDFTCMPDEAILIISKKRKARVFAAGSGMSK